MVREMKRALESLKSGDSQGYRKIFDAAYDEVYCRSFLIVQKEETALGFVKSFFTGLFGKMDEADDAESQERWFWQKYYEQMRKQYHKLLAEQGKGIQDSRVRTLAEIPSALPLLHRIMLVMHYKDDFTVREISGMFRLEEEKVREELNKLEKLLPVLVKGQPESVSGYLGSWKVLLLGASRQILSTGSDEWTDKLYAEIAADAGIASPSRRKKEDDFEYFIEDVEVSDVKDKKSKSVVLEEEPDDDDEDESEYDEDDDDEYDDDDDDEYDDDDDEEDDDRYDWDLEDDGRKMVILGIVLALIIVAVIGIAAFKLLGKDGGSTEPSPTEAVSGEDNDAELIIRGDELDEDTEEAENAEEQEEEPQEEESQEEEPAEPETLIMKVNASSVNVRSEANTDCDVLTTVKNGEQVEVLGDPSEEWVQIRCIEQTSQEGYVKTEFLTSIE